MEQLKTRPIVVLDAPTSLGLRPPAARHLSLLWAEALARDDPGRRAAMTGRAEEEKRRAHGLIVRSHEAFTATRPAGERVGRVYYAGHPVLFAGAAEHLRLGESCLTLLEECLARIAPSHGVDAEADARRWAGEHVALWLDLARVDTLEATGEVLAAEHILSGRIATLEEVANGSFRVSIADTVPSVACPRRPM